MGEFRAKWQTLSIYEKFEQTIVGVLTLVIGFIVTATTCQLILHTVKLAAGHIAALGDAEAFQGLFGMVLTVLIALELKHTLPVVKHHGSGIVQARVVVLIALLALVRRFIVLDLYDTTPAIIASLAGAALALGVVFWLVSCKQVRMEDEIEDME